MKFIERMRMWSDGSISLGDSHPSKIEWHQLPGRKLKASWNADDGGRGINDSDMEPIDEWLRQNIPSAKRLSFDMWLFKEDKHVTMFLLKWSS